MFLLFHPRTPRHALMRPALESRRYTNFFFPTDDNLGELMSTVCGVHVRGWAGVGACSAEGFRRPSRTRRRTARGRCVLFCEPRKYQLKKIPRCARTIVSVERKTNGRGEYTIVSRQKGDEEPVWRVQNVLKIFAWGAILTN